MTVVPKKCNRVADQAFPEIKVSWRQPDDFGSSATDLSAYFTTNICPTHLRDYRTGTTNTATAIGNIRTECASRHSTIQAGFCGSTYPAPNNPATWQPNEFDSWDRGIGISMHEDDSPNRSPTTIGSIDTSANSSLTRSTISTLAYWGLPMIGGIAGFVGYIFASITLECHDTATESILSYGQQAGLISLPMCTLISTATGFGIALTISRQYVTSVLLLLAVAFCGWAINNSLWNDQIKRYGPDQSEVVLYYPPLACSGLALFSAMAVAAWATLARRKKVT